jgi:hypothetical protein
MTFPCVYILYPCRNKTQGTRNLLKTVEQHRIRDKEQASAVEEDYID